VVECWTCDHVVAGSNVNIKQVTFL